MKYVVVNPGHYAAAFFGIMVMGFSLGRFIATDNSHWLMGCLLGVVIFVEGKVRAYGQEPSP